MLVREEVLETPLTFLVPTLYLRMRVGELEVIMERTASAWKKQELESFQGNDMTATLSRRARAVSGHDSEQLPPKEWRTGYLGQLALVISEYKARAPATSDFYGHHRRPVAHSNGLLPWPTPHRP